MDISAKKAKSLKNAEKRRERSKVAARCRRGKECQIFTDLSTSLPIPDSSRASLDKASVMRLTLCNLKIKKMMGEEFWNKKKMAKGIENEEYESQLNQALGGFVLVFTLDGDVIYASEGITTQLGVSQYEIMGQSIFDFSHQYDHNDIRNLLLVKKGDEGSQDGQQRSGLFRMKCTVSSRGRNAHLRTANYKVINCIGRVIEGKDEKWFVSMCEPLLHPSDVDIPLNKQTFLSKHSPDMKFEYVDESISQLLGYKQEELLGKSMFEFTHAMDGEGIAKSFKSLYEKDQNQTERYRFLTKGGGWIWIITQATVIHGNNGKSPNSVVCIHFVTSGKEEADQILSEVQIGEPCVVPEVPRPIIPLAERRANNNMALPTVKVNRAMLSSPPPSIFQQRKGLHKMSTEEENNFIADLLVGPLLNNARCSTAKIFAPKTEDMDTGFLMPLNDDDTLIVSKEEPEDLTHLAPIAGDEFVPLEVPLLEDLLASLDEADNMGYSFLDQDSEDIMQFDIKVKPEPVKRLKPLKIPLPQLSDNSSPMMRNVDPPMVGSPSSVSSLLSPYRDCSSPVPPMCVSPQPPLPIMMDDQFLCGPMNALSPIPVEMMEKLPPVLKGTAEQVQTWNKLINKEPLALVDELKQKALKGKASGRGRGRPPKTVPPDPEWNVLAKPLAAMNGGLMKEASPTPSKVSRLVQPGEGSGFSGFTETIPPVTCSKGGERIYILVPVPVNRRKSNPMLASSGSDSDSNDEGSGNAKGHFDLVDLIQRGNQSQEQQAQINKLLSTIGLMNHQEKNANGACEYKRERSRKRDFTGSLLSDKPFSFHELTRQDCEVNAPLSMSSELLQGPDLLRALEMGSSGLV